MQFHYDLRDLFVIDHFNHSGIYDCASDGLVMRLRGGVNFPLKMKNNHYRLCVVREFSNEVEIQQGLARLLLRAAGTPKPYTRVLRSDLAIVVHPDTLTKVDSQLYQKAGARNAYLKAWCRLLSLGRAIYLSRHIDADVIISVDISQDGLLINTGGGASPYPMGAAVRQGNVVQAHSLVENPCRSKVKSGT